jgi:hypothetical protein
MEKLKILAIPPNQGGCAFYRVINPMQKLQELYWDKVEIRINDNPLELDVTTNQFPDFNDQNTLKDMRWADVIFVHTITQFGPQYTAMIVNKAKELKKFIHYDTDDLLTDLFEGHRLYSLYKEQKLDDLTKYLYGKADLTTVTQGKFAKRISSHVYKGGGVLAIVRNSIDYNLPNWNLKKTNPKNKNFIRVGWAGGIHHEEDVRAISAVPHIVNSKVGKENVSWDFYGRPEQPKAGEKKDWQHDVWDNYQKIILKGFKGANNWNISNALSPLHYGVFFANMEIAIAPLQPNAFNDSKSDIKVAECGRYKVPLIASNVGCYDETIINGETGYLIDPEEGRAGWVRVLSKCIKNPNHVREMGENLFNITEEYFDLNKVCWRRLSLYEHCFSFLREKHKDYDYNREWTFNNKAEEIKDLVVC